MLAIGFKIIVGLCVKTRRFLKLSSTSFYSGRRNPAQDRWHESRRLRHFRHRNPDGRLPGFGQLMKILDAKSCLFVLTLKRV